MKIFFPPASNNESGGGRARERKQGTVLDGGKEEYTGLQSWKGQWNC